MSSDEPILEPDLPIVDAHHHLWDVTAKMATLGPVTHPLQAMERVRPRYLLDEFLADIRLGHNIRATVYVQSQQVLSFYRREGAPAAAPAGETEFANGVAVMAAGGLYGDIRVCAAIVGYADLRLDDILEGLEAHLAAGGGRFRGIRQAGTWDADPEVLGGITALRGLYASDAFRRGFARLAPLGLMFDACVLEPQLGELVDLARAFPETTIVVDHTGMPVGVGCYAGLQATRFPLWRESIIALAACPNVVVKLGGLGFPLTGLGTFLAEPPMTAARLAHIWKPYIETCIEAFGARRCMFESNFPADAGSAGYETIWNAFKIIAQGASADEKAWMFSRTAQRVYGLSI
jgi:predicted TIM-barrel fold metal-dependent hydrolase